MEERVVRAFAGLINQLRQEDLGIEQYIWRSQDDAKVPDSHAAYDDRVFRWADPPEGGHPGEAYNCRCNAEPVLPGVQSNVVLADFAPTAGGVPALDPTDTIRGLRALSGVGTALLASDALQGWTEAMRDRRADEAGARLGIDVTTVERRLAATAYVLDLELVPMLVAVDRVALSEKPQTDRRERIACVTGAAYSSARAFSSSWARTCDQSLS